MTNLIELAALVEKLEGPDRSVDWAIHLRDGLAGVGMYGAHPHYTASLDAAMTLVAPTCLFWCRELWDDQRKAGYAGINIYRDMTHVGETTAVAAAPALALCAAALKARAHLEGE